MNLTDLYNDLEIENENPGDTETLTGDENLSEDENLTEGENPGGDGNPSEDENSDGDENPGEDENPEESGNPGENENPSEDGNPGEAEDPMQAILDGIRESLGENDENVDSLIESVRSLVDVMSMDQYQPMDIYTPPDIPIDGYKAWDYPITVDYMIKIVGYDDMMPQSMDYDNHEQFLEDFQDIALNCYRGTVFTDFYIDKVWGADNKKLYDSQGMVEPEPEEPTPEEPAEDLTPAILETLQSIDSRLMIIGEDLTTVSENTVAYHNDMLLLQEQNNALQFHLLVTSIGLGFTVFLLLGYIIAHGFWQRMRTG